MDAKLESAKYLNLRKFNQRALSDYNWNSYIRRKILMLGDTRSENDAIRHPNVQQVMVEGCERFFKDELARSIEARPPDPLLAAISRLEDEYNKKFAFHYHTFKTYQEAGKSLTSQQAEYIANVENNIVNEIKKNIRLLRHNLFRRAYRSFLHDPGWSRKYDKACKRAEKELRKASTREQQETSERSGMLGRFVRNFFKRPPRVADESLESNPPLAKPVKMHSPNHGEPQPTTDFSSLNL